MSKHTVKRGVFRRLIRAWAPAALWLMAGCGQGPAGTLAISDAWVKEPVPGRAMAAGFLKIENKGAGEEVLLGIECEDAVVEMHDMVHEGGMMKMHKMEQWTIPAQGSLVLKPGGGHLMFMGLRRQLKAGDTVQLTLQFKGAGDRTLSAPVKKQ